MIKLNAKELRKNAYDPNTNLHIKKNPVYIIVDNVLDTYNIGAIFRLADAVAVEKVILCAGSEIPPNSRIKKASINTTEWVKWEYSQSAIKAIRDLRMTIPEIQVVSVEQNEKSISYTRIPYSFPVALIVGHETDGVSIEALEASDYIAEIPMWGVNKSLNVMVSLGIVLFQVMQKKEVPS